MYELFETPLEYTTRYLNSPAIDRTGMGCGARYRYSLGCTSLWMLVPLCAACQCEGACTTARALLFLLAGTACAVSTTFFLFAGETSSAHFQMDIWLARSLFVSLFLFHSLDADCAQLPQAAKFAFPAAIGVLYGMGITLTKAAASVWSHLCFRYVGLWSRRALMLSYSTF